MSYSDKCCGMCGEYQDIDSSGKRFAIANVCKRCTKQVTTLNISEFKYVKYNHKVDRSHGYVHYIDGDGIFKRASASRFDDTCRESKLHPWLYEVDFSKGLIYSKDKRNLRRALRKAGIIGKIEKVVK